MWTKLINILAAWLFTFLWTSLGWGGGTPCVLQSPDSVSSGYRVGFVHCMHFLQIASLLWGPYFVVCNGCRCFSTWSAAKMVQSRTVNHISSDWFTKYAIPNSGIMQINCLVQSIVPIPNNPLVNCAVRHRGKCFDFGAKNHSYPYNLRSSNPSPFWQSWCYVILNGFHV